MRRGGWEIALSGIVTDWDPQALAAAFTALCGFKTWSLILRVERKLKVFENRVLKRIFGPKSD